MKTELSLAADDDDNVNTSFDTKAATDICSLNDDDQSKADESKRRAFSIAGVSILVAALLLTVALGAILSRRSDSSSTAAFTPERLDADAPSPPQPVEPPTAEPSSIAIPPLEIARFYPPTESPSQTTSSPSTRRQQATVSPTFAPTTAAPTAFPTTNPTVSPTFDPTVSPTLDPTWNPTSSPSTDPSAVLTLPPTTSSPSTVSPTFDPTASPSTDPTESPTTRFPTYTPTIVSNNDCAIRQRPPPPPLPGKKGIGFTLRDSGQRGSWEENLPRVIALRPHWNYKWGLERIEAQPDDIEFVPMVWGAKNLDVLEERLEEWVIPHVQTGKVKRLLGFNEPDRAQQANMEPIQAMDAWPVLERLNISLTSPSCAHAEGRWMETFMAGVACPESIDWVGVHWYGGTNFWSFRSKMTRIYELHGNRPLLLTEFAPADWNALTPQQNRHSTAAVLDFMKRALPWLEETEWIAGYAWFPFAPDWPAGSSSSLFDQAGNLTAVGRYYASVRAENPMGDQSITDDE